MIKYDDFLNEAISKSKLDEIAIDDFVICSKNFRYINDAVGKLAQITNIKKVGGIVIYSLKLQEPNAKPNGAPPSYSDWKVYQKSPKHLIHPGWVDKFNINKNQASRSLLKVTPEIAAEWKKWNIIQFKSSKIFNDILTVMNFKIKMPFVDISYVDIDQDKNDMITFVPISKYKTEVMGKYGVNPYEVNFRQPMKVNKLLRKLNPDINEKDVEELIANYKKSYDLVVKNAGNRLTVVTGNDIKYWYLVDNYGKDNNGNSGTLGGSCMRYLRSQRRFKIYTENPDKVAMIIYKNLRLELMARALIWKLDDGSVYMDRIYYVDNASKAMLKSYAKEKGMLEHDRGQGDIFKMSVKLNKDYGDPKNNPYMDTFKWFEKSTNTLVNALTIKNLTGYSLRDKFYNYTDHD